MAKLSYPDELVALLEEYLSVGTISGRARQMLLNKAQSLGVDIDEFDLYIDLQQKKKINQENSVDSKKRGVLCPFCGTPVPPLAEKCPNCENFITPKANEDLVEILDHLENALVEFKTGKDMDRNKANVERYVLKAQTYYENNPKVKKLLEVVKAELVAAAKRADEEKERARKRYEDETERLRKRAEEEAERVREEAERVSEEAERARRHAEDQAERARKEEERKRRREHREKIVSSKHFGCSVFIAAIVAIVAIVSISNVCSERSLEKHLKILNEEVTTLISKDDLNGANTTLENVIL